MYDIDRRGQLFGGSWNDAMFMINTLVGHFWTRKEIESSVSNFKNVFSATTRRDSKMQVGLISSKRWEVATNGI